MHQLDDSVTHSRREDTIETTAIDATAGPKSPARVLQLLGALAHSPVGLSLAAITAGSDVPKTTILSHLRALEEAGYVTRSGGAYVLGEEAIKLGAAMAGAASFLPSIREVLKGLAAQTGETAFLATLTPDSSAAVYEEVVESVSTIRFSVQVGALRPLYCSAVGMALLGFQSPASQALYLQHAKLVKHVAGTITGKRELQAELKYIRNAGIAISLDRMVEGGGGIAAPISNRDGNVTSCVGCGFPTIRFEAKRDLLVAATREAAQQISRLMGYRPIQKS